MLILVASRADPGLRWCATTKLQGPLPLLVTPRRRSVPAPSSSKGRSRLDVGDPRRHESIRLIPDLASLGCTDLID